MSNNQTIRQLKARIAELERERNASQQQVKALRVAMEVGRKALLEAIPLVKRCGFSGLKEQEAAAVMKAALAQQATLAKCKACNGTGQQKYRGLGQEFEYRCPDCDGTGKQNGGDDAP